MTSVRPQDSERLFDVNVRGTKLVMEECLRAEVERVVYTSSAAVVGPAAHGKTADETQLFTAGRLGIPYVNSVHEAEVEAMRAAARGLPLVCVNPAICFGAGDYLLSSTRLVRSFLLGRVPVYTDGAVSVVDVRDVAAGHLLADRHGETGERYILGGRNFTFERLFADLGRLSGIDPPVRLPPAAARAAAGLLASAGRVLAADAARGASGQPVVDLPLDARAARPRLDGAPARGDAGGDGRLAPGARAGSDQAHSPLAADPVPPGGRGDRRHRDRGRPAAPRRGGASLAFER